MLGCLLGNLFWLSFPPRSLLLTRSCTCEHTTNGRPVCVHCYYTSCSIPILMPYTSREVSGYAGFAHVRSGAHAMSSPRERGPLTVNVLRDFP